MAIGMKNDLSRTIDFKVVFIFTKSFKRMGYKVIESKIMND